MSEYHFNRACAYFKGSAFPHFLDLPSVRSDFLKIKKLLKQHVDCDKHAGIQRLSFVTRISLDSRIQYGVIERKARVRSNIVCLLENVLTNIKKV